MRLPRLRLWVLMVAVALAGIGTGGYVLFRRSSEFRRRTETYAKAAAVADRQLQSSTDTIASFEYSNKHWKKRSDVFSIVHAKRNEDFIAEMRRSVEKWQRFRGFCRQLQRKYERAARHPFLPVEPDPVAPPLQ